ncbi:uncharacterized protein LOC126839166 [Adelges cooleyi]|uniref:uncharacterized protein LOC126839166 n=1 Tax=Adelges cooleyi TaxID=133065 RepID=UPI0021806726|nr:uncharacterized protein LOC126839166 [Adelges cooleyi]
MSFLDIVSKFNQQAVEHNQSQALNPFSGRYEQSRSPSPRFSREEYGKPIAGSKTDLRGRKAKSHICREILELCTVIHDVGTYNTSKKGSGDQNEFDDGTIIISFGELFQIYTKISDKVVGLLIAAKRRGFVFFDREILYQRRDDDVLIALLKPISEISKVLKADIEQANTLPTADVNANAVNPKTSEEANKTHHVTSVSERKHDPQKEPIKHNIENAIKVNGVPDDEVNINGEKPTIASEAVENNDDDACDKLDTNDNGIVNWDGEKKVSVVEENESEETNGEVEFGARRDLIEFRARQEDQTDETADDDGLVLVEIEKDADDVHDIIKDFTDNNLMNEKVAQTAESNESLECNRVLDIETVGEGINELHEIDNVSDDGDSVTEAQETDDEAEENKAVNFEKVVATEDAAVECVENDEIKTDESDQKGAECNLIVEENVEVPADKLITEENAEDLDNTPVSEENVEILEDKQFGEEFVEVFEDKRIGDESLIDETHVEDSIKDKSYQNAEKENTDIAGESSEDDVLILKMYQVVNEVENKNDTQEEHHVLVETDS